MICCGISHSSRSDGGIVLAASKLREIHMRHSQVQAEAIPLTNSHEKFVELKEAAEVLGLKRYVLQRGARAKLFPTYTIYNNKKYCRISEVVAVMERARAGGAQ